MFRYIKVTGADDREVMIVAIAHITEVFFDGIHTHIGLPSTYTRCEESVEEILTLIEEALNAN